MDQREKRIHSIFAVSYPKTNQAGHLYREQSARKNQTRPAQRREAWRAIPEHQPSLVRPHKSLLWLDKNRQTQQPGKLRKLVCLDLQELRVLRRRRATAVINRVKGLVRWAWLGKAADLVLALLQHLVREKAPVKFVENVEVLE